jgi:hypothetical protein
MKDKTHKSAVRNGFTRRRFLQLSTLAAGGATFGVPYLLRAKGLNDRMNVAFIGLGGQGTSRLREIQGCGVNVTAFCDMDENQFAKARAQAIRAGASADFNPTTYVDYRKLLDSEKNLDAVVIATPDHWHALTATAALHAGKNVFCEKPLCHSVSEIRGLRKLANKTKVVTQMGNQGSAQNTLRRGIELIQAGVIGEVREIHTWVVGAGCDYPGRVAPPVGDPILAGLHWDGWLGPAPARPYMKGWYHTWFWRGWFDFGNGVIADFGCHNLNLAYRALKLDYPVRIEADGQLMGLPTYPAKARIAFDFAARENLPPLTIWWYDGGRMPPPEVIPPAITEHFGALPNQGVLILGDKGFTFGDPWKNSEYIKLNDEPRLSGILQHEATKNIPETLPRINGAHLKEWVDACNGGPPVHSSFEVGGKLAEIALSGAVALRTQQTLDWDGENMRAKNTPDAQKYVDHVYRKGWTI